MNHCKLRIIFSKSGALRFISHLDLLRLFHRASRRAKLPVAITKGFSPHLKISITRALKLGVESDNEEAYFYLSEKVPPSDFKDSMNMKLPRDIRIKKATESD